MLTGTARRLSTIEWLVTMQSPDATPTEIVRAFARWMRDRPWQYDRDDRKRVYRWALDAHRNRQPALNLASPSNAN